MKKLIVSVVIFTLIATSFTLISSGISKSQHPQIIQVPGADFEFRHSSCDHSSLTLINSKLITVWDNIDLAEYKEGLPVEVANGWFWPLEGEFVFLSKKPEKWDGDYYIAVRK